MVGNGEVPLLRLVHYIKLDSIRERIKGFSLKAVIGATNVAIFERACLEVGRVVGKIIGLEIGNEGCTTRQNNES